MKVLILTSSTGGGHNMRARSLTSWIHKLSPKTTVRTHKVLESTHGLYQFGVSLYNAIQRHAPWFHHVYFNYLELASMFRSGDRILGGKRFMRLLLEEQPDVVVSVHGSTNHGFFELARRALTPERVKCITYCGELFGGYGFSRHWVNPEADIFIGAVEETCVAAREHQMPDSKAIIGGFLLNPAFYETPISEAEKRRFITDNLGMDPDQFILMLSTGEAGANNHIPLLKALLRDGLRLQVVVLCGKRLETFQAVSAWAKSQRTLNVRPLAYTDRMRDLLQCASAVVARPGTGTTSEAIISGCPIILNGLGGIMPQEWITVKFCRQHGIGPVIHRAADLPGIIEEWEADPSHAVRHKEKISAALPRQNPRQILELLGIPIS